MQEAVRAGGGIGHYRAYMIITANPNGGAFRSGALAAADLTADRTIAHNGTRGRHAFILTF